MILWLKEMILKETLASLYTLHGIMYNNCRHGTHKAAITGSHGPFLTDSHRVNVV